MHWYKHELIPNDIINSIPPVSFLILHPRDTNNYAIIDSSETEKTLKENYARSRVLHVGIARNVMGTCVCRINILKKSTHAREYYT